MKVVHVPFCYYPDPAGGTESYVRSLAHSLRQQHVESCIAAPAECEATYTHEGFRVRRFPIGLVTNLRDLYGEGDSVAAHAFGRILDEELPDLVHLHAFTRAVSVQLVRKAKLRGLPVVFTYHTPTVSCQRGTLMHWGNEVCDGALNVRRCTACALHGLGLNRAASVALSQLPPAVGRVLGDQGRAGGVWTALRMTELVELRHTALRALLAEVDAIVALCNWTQALLVRNDVPPEKITVSHHGLSYLQRDDRTPRSTNLPGQRTLRIAFLGRLDPSKGVDLLLGALRLLPEVAVELDIYGIVQAGGANYSEHLHDLAMGDGRIRFLPPVPGDQVIDLLAGYDLLGVPSQICETGPLVVLDAFAAGTPVLGARLGGIAELVTDGVDGLLVEPDSVEAWRAALERLGCDGELLERLRNGVRPPRRMEQVVNEMLLLYTRLCDKEGSVATTETWNHGISMNEAVHP